MKNKDKKKLDMVKIQGIIGLIIFVSILVVGKLSAHFEVDPDYRYWGAMFLLLLGGFSLFLIKNWLDHK